MSPYVESNIEFDFSAAKSLIEHDKTTPGVTGGSVHGNNVWPGVDYCIEEASGEWIWLEVKIGARHTSCQNGEAAHVGPSFAR